MKIILIIAILTSSVTLRAQKYFTKSGKTEFKASVEAFDPVEAINNSTTAILNVATGEVASLLFVKAFHFEIALMEEHFNENYMDSEEYPKSSFKGNIEGFNLAILTDSFQEMNLVGKLKIKGIEKEISTPMRIRIVNRKIQCKSSFIVKSSDFDIKIPRIVRKKLTENINIIFNYELIKKD